MKKEIIYMKQKVLITYESKEDREKAIKSLKDYPNSLAVGGCGYGFRKASEQIKIIIQKKSKTKKQ